MWARDGGREDGGVASSKAMDGERFRERETGMGERMNMASVNWW